MTFFRDRLLNPLEELNELRSTEFWPPIIADAEASLGDLRALSRYDFKPERFHELQIPVMLQIGTESPRHLYVTDALAAVLPHASIQELHGQAHEAMTTAPRMYAEAVCRFLLSQASHSDPAISGAVIEKDVFAEDGRRAVMIVPVGNLRVSEFSKRRNERRTLVISCL